ncbi:MAG: hypothetical protein EXR73_03395 [Myxococcales bacterium]|nr:hypothetical protein [Myxococcales bacterium]
MKLQRFLVIALLTAAWGCSGRCGAGGAGDQATVAPPTVAPALRPLPDPTRVELAAPTATGARRFQLPHGEELLAVAATADGRALVALSPTRAYFFDADADTGRSVKLPALVTAPVVVALSSTRVAVLSVAPTTPPDGRLHLVDAARPDEPTSVTLGGAPVFAALLQGGRLAVVLREPPALAIHDAASGERIALHTLPRVPARLEVAPDGSWAAVAATGNDEGAGGVVTVDVAGPEPVFAFVSLGASAPTDTAARRPLLALPTRDALLVAGQAADGRPFALVVPRAGGEPLAGLEIGAGRLLGAARAGDRLVLFTEEPGVGRRTYVFGAADHAVRSVIADGPSNPRASVVEHAGALFVPRCHDLLELDLAAGSSRVVHEARALRAGSCLTGLWRLGERIVFAEPNQLVVWAPPR